MSLTDCFMSAFMVLCWALSPSSWWCVRVHPCLRVGEEIKWHHYCVRLPIRFVPERRYVFPHFTFKSLSLSRRPRHMFERIRVFKIKPADPNMYRTLYHCWKLVDKSGVIYFKVRKKKGNSEDGDTEKDPQYMPLYCLHPTQSSIHTHISYCFCVIVICVGAEIALLDKSILVPLDGHCGSRERP